MGLNLPAALAPLAAYRQFITYRLVPRIDKPGKFDKLPCVWDTGGVTSKGSGGAHDPAVWCSAEEALACQLLADRGHGSGIGFVFTDNDPYWVVDIDNCYDAGAWSPVALEICETLKGAAVEVSQSGKGLHLFGRGDVPTHRCKNIPLGLEFYTTGRFIALSKNPATGNVDADLSGILPAFVDRYFKPMESRAGAIDEWTSEPCEGWQGPSDDDELIARALRSSSTNHKFRGGICFADLYERNCAALANKWPGSNDGGYDASSADMSLAMHLAFWTGRDCERMERLMRGSELSREKYERHSYLTDTIMKAVGLSSDVYSKPDDDVPPPPPVDVPPPPGRSDEPSVSISLTNEQAKDKQEHLAIQYWLAGLRYVPAYDEFADRVMLNGEPLTDHGEREAWFDVREKSGVKYAKDLFSDVLRRVAWSNRYHPLRLWLDRVQTAWDGTPRIDSWLNRYLGVDQSAYSDAIGSLFLVAAVRRARRPGAKFDEMMVLEGPQGIEKSTAIALLSPELTWFCDDVHVGMKSKELLEQTAGKWIVEAPELSRMSDSEVEHIKAMLSRQFDRARLSYERNPSERGRQWVAFATTNKDRYLRDPTGNRRLWPVRVNQVDLAGILSDRDQLWAEAAVREASGASIRLSQHLWADAAVEQEARTVADPFEDVLRSALGDMQGRIKSEVIWSILGIPIDRRRQNVRPLGDALHRLGWRHARFRVDGDRTPYYVRGLSDVEIDYNEQRILAPIFTVIQGGKL